MKKLLLAWTILLSAAVMCWAQEHREGASGAAAHGAAHAADPSPHPAVPDHPAWVKPVVILIGTMFVLAFLVGPLVRALTPQEMPATHAHDEHHGHKDPHGDQGLGGHDAHGHDAHH